MKSAKFLSDNSNPIVPIIGSIWLLFAMVNYIATAFTEPGFLPRNKTDEANHTEVTNNITVDLSGRYYPEPPLKVTKINGSHYSMKYCVS